MSLERLIALDDEKTWPPTIVALLSSISQPVDDQNLLSQILQHAQPHDIVGFHATRLHRVHIDELRSGTRSLSPLSVGDEAARVADMVRQGVLTQAEADALLVDTQARQPYRSGLLGLYFTEKIFETSACFCFFRYWGGEPLGQYGSHGNILRQIGVPCVVEVSVPIRCVPFISGADFANAYTQNRRGVRIDAGMYGYVKDPKCPVTVRDVIEFGSHRFTAMTSKAKWCEAIHP